MICDRRRLKGKIYKLVVRRSVMYDFKVELKILLYIFWSDHEDKKLVY